MTRLTVVGYSRATPRPATSSPTAPRVSTGAAQNSAKPAAAQAVQTRIRARSSGTRRMIRADMVRVVAMPTRKSEASAGAWLREARSQAMNAAAAQKTKQNSTLTDRTRSTQRPSIGAAAPDGASAARRDPLGNARRQAGG